MVGPARKREAVEHVRRSLAVSERRACQATGQPRSTQRYLLKRWGEVIGRIDRQGDELFFSIFRDGEPFDPLKFVQGK